MVFGVSSWLSKRIGLSEGLIRIGFVLLTVIYGTGIALYLILWIVKLISARM